MEERSVLIPVPLEEADAIVSHAVTNWRLGARRLAKQEQTRPDGVRQITGCYELKVWGVSDSCVLETRVEEQNEGALVSWCCPGKGEELLMTNPKLLDFLQNGIARALRPYRAPAKRSVWNRLLGFLE